jgi:hypothetical protein
VESLYLRLRKEGRETQEFADYIPNGMKWIWFSLKIAHKESADVFLQIDASIIINGDGLITKLEL